jgi:SulP family sulfate permease
VIIFSSQLRDFFGLRMETVPAGFIEKLGAYRSHFDTINSSALLVGALSLAILILWPRISHRIPAPLVAIIVLTAAVQLLHLPVETIGSRFGGVPNHLLAPSLPRVSWQLVQEMFSPAITIAFLCAIESLLAAVVADGMMGTRHRSNMELIAQGVGNIASTLFGGIPATGAIARTATNIKSGGRTPVAGVIHSLVLLLILLFFGNADNKDRTIAVECREIAAKTRGRGVNGQSRLIVHFLAYPGVLN